MFTSINPATGQPGQSHAELTDAQVEGRLAKAHDAFQAWRISAMAANRGHGACTNS